MHVEIYFKRNEEGKGETSEIKIQISHTPCLPALSTSPKMSSLGENLNLRRTQMSPTFKAHKARLPKKKSLLLFAKTKKTSLKKMKARKTKQTKNRKEKLERTTNFKQTPRSKEKSPQQKTKKKTEARSEIENEGK